MTHSLVLTTYDWVPEPPRGYVRDLRVRWALEEAGLPYRVESTSFRNRSSEHASRLPRGEGMKDGQVQQAEMQAGGRARPEDEQQHAVLPSIRDRHGFEDGRHGGNCNPGAAPATTVQEAAV